MAATLHHTALAKGYIKVGQEIREEYNGRFGTGYTVKTHNPNSTRFCFIAYYINK